MAEFCTPMASTMAAVAVTRAVWPWARPTSTAMLSREAVRISTAACRQASAASATSRPAKAPMTNRTMMPAAAPASRVRPWAKATAIWVVLPLMNETNRPPSRRKPMASTQPAIAVRVMASSNWATSVRLTFRLSLKPLSNWRRARRPGGERRLRLETAG